MKKILKTAAAALCAAAILCGIFALYYAVPGRVPNALGNTAFVWPANARWLQMEEGVSWGRADEWGFNNPQVVPDPDILLLGSSHMEGMNVRQEETAAAVLSGIAEGEMSVYNMGMSGHDLPEICHYLPNTLLAFEKAPEYIAIEIRSLAFGRDDMDFVLSQPQRQQGGRKGIGKAFFDLPLMSLLNRKMDTGLVDLLLPARTAGAQEGDGAERPYGELMAYLARCLEGCDTQLLFMYHRPGKIDANGGISFTENPYRMEFEKACMEAGFVFIDMAEPFTKLYEQERIVPYGFMTGAANEGHLNAQGHRVLAETIWTAVLETEGR